jgi:hypothetical protein
MALTKNNRQQIRHDIYDYLVEQGFDLTLERKALLAGKIKAAGKLQAEHYDKRGKQAGFAAWKIEQYLLKAKTVPQSPTIKIQVETLKLVSSWLGTSVEEIDSNPSIG